MFWMMWMRRLSLGTARARRMIAGGTSSRLSMRMPTQTKAGGSSLSIILGSNGDMRSGLQRFNCFGTGDSRNERVASSLNWGSRASMTR